MKSYNDLLIAVEEFVNVCQEGDFERLKALLDGGLNPRLGQQKPLTAAILNNHPKIVNLLLNRGALDQCTVISKTEGMWPSESADTTCSLQFAAMNGRVEIVRTILSIDIRLVNCVDSVGRTALSFAARAGHTEVVRVLIEAKADLNGVNHAGVTAI